MKKAGLVLVMLSFFFNGWCQKDSTIKHHFLTNFQLRQSFETSDEQQSPAQLQLTIPGNGKLNWLVDAAAGFTLPSLSFGSFTSKIDAEYHRNTLVNAEQNNYQFGFNFRWFNRNKGGNLNLIYTGNTKYLRDETITAGSLGVTLNVSGYKRKGNGLKLGLPVYLNHYKYTYVFSPYIAGQFQDFFATGSQQIKGLVFRPVANVYGAFAINKPIAVINGERVILPQKLIEIIAGGTARYAIVNNTGNTEGYTKLIKTGLNYYFYNNGPSSVSFGMCYNIGSDPLNGLKNQNFLQFTLQVQI